MKHTKRTPLWYNPMDKDSRRRARGEGQLAADREGRALLETYWRLYRDKL